MNAMAGKVTGWHVLAVIAAFFVTIIGVNAGFIYYAVSSFPGEDVPHSYLQGLNYNKTLAARAAQQKLGWRATAEIQKRGDDEVIVANFSDAHGAPLTGLTLTGVLRHPVDGHADITLSFKPDSAGSYVANVGEIPPGAWLLRGSARRGADEFDFERRQTWQASP